MKRKVWALAGAMGLLTLSAAGLMWNAYGAYGFNVMLRRGGTFWINLKADDKRLPLPMQLALRKPVPQIQAGQLVWQKVEPGFEVADLPVLSDGHEIDRILLNRIDAKYFKFIARNSPSGDKGIDEWEHTLPQAVLIVNGSYYGKKGLPDTPFISDGMPSGPPAYDAHAGAFIAGDGFADVKDLTRADWRSAFKGARNAMVSYPLLIGDDGKSHVATKSLWLANRTFVGKDSHGLIVIGTTREAFFSLERLAAFLKESPLDLRATLNLDGGPVACQSVRLDGFHRKFYAQWEAQTDGTQVKLLRWPFARAHWAMPVVLTVERRR